MQGLRNEDCRAELRMSPGQWATQQYHPCVPGATWVSFAFMRKDQYSVDFRGDLRSPGVRVKVAPEGAITADGTLRTMIQEGDQGYAPGRGGHPPPHPTPPAPPLPSKGHPHHHVIYCLRFSASASVGAAAVWMSAVSPSTGEGGSPSSPPNTSRTTTPFQGSPPTTT